MRWVLMLLSLLAVVWTGAVQAGPWSLLEIEGGSVEYRQYHVLRDPYIPEEEPSYWRAGGAFSERLALVRHRPSRVSLFWENRLHFAGTESQIRHGGWEFKTGFARTDIGTMVGWDTRVEVFYYHHSQHVMEHARATRAYPLENATVFKLEWRPK